MYIGVYNGDVIGYYCYMNISTGYDINNHNSVEYTKNKRKKFYQKVFKGG